jgi:hypothetical protein
MHQRRRRRVIRTLLAVPLAGAAVVAGTMEWAQAEPGLRRERSVASCADEHDDTGATTGEAGSPAGGAVAVGVPATAMLHLGSNGAIRYATTNTGCPPRPTDDLWYVTDDDEYRPAPPAAADGTWWTADSADTYLRDAD